MFVQVEVCLGESLGCVFNCFSMLCSGWKMLNLEFLQCVILLKLQVGSTSYQHQLNRKKKNLVLYNF